MKVKYIWVHKENIFQYSSSSFSLLCSAQIMSLCCFLLYSIIFQGFINYTILCLIFHTFFCFSPLFTHSEYMSANISILIMNRMKLLPKPVSIPSNIFHNILWLLFLFFFALQKSISSITFLFAIS